MHGLLAAFPVVMAAEKSRTVFYVVGGVTAAWAVFVSLALGLRRPSFASDAASSRIVMAISLVLVIATGATSILTETTPAKPAAAAASAAAPSSAAAGAPRAAASAASTSRP
jgi:hypothetical protein